MEKGREGQAINCSSVVFSGNDNTSVKSDGVAGTSALMLGA